ncbi:hypothetical protein CNY67_01765 [Desulfovibrio sp. G11]|nr:hypothetical protein CNY67_01765 [Desulfovibrio sp. G11]
MSFEIGFLSPCGRKGFFFVCYFGRLRGVRQGGAGYGAAPPSRPPLHPPEAPPLGFPYSISPPGYICAHSGQSCWAFLLP